MKKILIGLLICFVNTSCLEKIADKYDSNCPVSIRLINRDELDFAEITVIGKKDSSGVKVAGFTSTFQSGLQLPIGARFQMGIVTIWLSIINGHFSFP